VHRGDLSKYHNLTVSGKENTNDATGIITGRRSTWSTALSRRRRTER